MLLDAPSPLPRGGAVDADTLAFAADLALGVFLLALAALAPRIPRPGPARWLLAAYLAPVGLHYAGDGVARLTGLKGRGTALDFTSAATTAFDGTVPFGGTMADSARQRRGQTPQTGQYRARETDL